MKDSWDEDLQDKKWWMLYQSVTQHQTLIICHQSMIQSRTPDTSPDKADERDKILWFFNGRLFCHRM